ncbi:hypothetical protein [Nocardia sp. NPDC058480]
MVVMVECRRRFTVSAILLSPRVVRRAFEPEPGGTSLFGFFLGAM